MNADLETELIKHGFTEVADNLFERGTLLKHTVSMIGPQLVLYASVLDPFYGNGEPFYVTCFHGEVDESGVTTKTAFLTTYEQLKGQVGNEISSQISHCKYWLKRFWDLREVSRLFEDAFQKRQIGALGGKGVLRRVFGEVTFPVLNVAKPSRSYPPIYDYVQSLLQFHLKNFTQSLAHAEKYAAIFTHQSDASDRQRMERMIESIKQLGN